MAKATGRSSEVRSEILIGKELKKTSHRKKYNHPINIGKEALLH